MKRKIIALMCFVLCCVMLFGACSASGGYDSSNNGYPPADGSDNAQTSTFDSDLVVRKIIYNANLTVQCDNLKTAIKLLKDNMNGDEWFDKEEVYLDYTVFAARVKSTRLDDFIDAISESGTVRDYKKTATDVSLEYSNKQLQVDALKDELARMQELYAQATHNEAINIGTRITSLIAQISQLENALRLTDSSVDYSTVTITLTEKYVAPVVENVKFGQRFVTVLKDSLNALVSFFQFLLLVLTAVFPFALGFAPFVVLIAFIVKWRKKKQKAQLAKTQQTAKEFENKIDSML